MRSRLGSALVGFVLVFVTPVVHAQDVEDLFRTINPSVVVVRAKGREVSAVRGVSTFNETGSGVLISADGKVVTAAHVVHAMDEITVEFLGGDTIKAHVVESEPAADLSLLQRERVPASAKVVPLGDSDKVPVGAQVVVGVGYLVKAVAKGSPAWNAGILGGDRTATINGQEIVVRGDVILEIEAAVQGDRAAGGHAAGAHREAAVTAADGARSAPLQ